MRIVLIENPTLAGFRPAHFIFEGRDVTLMQLATRVAIRAFVGTFDDYLKQGSSIDNWDEAVESHRDMLFLNLYGKEFPNVQASSH